MAQKETKQKIRYYIVEYNALSIYGSENGSDRADAERLLVESGEAVGKLVVIRGVVIIPTFNLAD